VPSSPTRPDPDSVGGWSDPGAPGSDAAAPAEQGPRYVVGALLGRGGMGAVHAARDQVLGRDVALKELAPNLADSPGAAARLAREAAITSRLDHPGIVAVHDRGLLPDGRPYYTMRLVRGRTLGRAAGEARDNDTRRQLFRHVLAAAEAVAAAHDVGVVHRDLKPANILIGPHGETQVVDWGLATPTAAAADRWLDLPAMAATGPVGTAPFASPEQARGAPTDPRHDVWSLGQTLAEVAGDEPPPELAAIVARATAADIDLRYPDAAAFADDLLRWFDGRRVGAHVYSPTELLRRTVAAYRLPLTVGAAAFLLVAASLAGGWWQTQRALERAQGAEADARAALADLRLEQAVVAARSGAREAAERLALHVLQERDDPLARGVFAAFGRAARPTLVGDLPGPSCAWQTLAPAGDWVLCGTADTVNRWEGGATIWSVPMRSTWGDVQGDSALVEDSTGHTVALDVVTGERRGRWGANRTGWVPAAAPRVVWNGARPLGVGEAVGPGCGDRLQVGAIGPDGRLAAVCDDGRLLLGTGENPASLVVATEVHGDHSATALAWTPDGLVVVGTLRGRIHVFDGASGQLLARGGTTLGAIRTLRIGPDGNHVAIGGSVGGVGLWRRDTGALVAEVPAARPFAVALTAAGLVVSDGRLRTWRLPRGAPALLQATAGLADVSASPGGERAATASGGGGVGLVDLRDGTTEQLRLGDHVVKAVAFDQTGSRLMATGMAAPFVAIAAEGGTWLPLPSPPSLRRLAWLADGSVVGVDLHAGLVRWEAPDRPPQVLAPARLFVDLERDAESLVALDSLGQIDRLDGASLTPLAAVPGARAIAARAGRLAIAMPDGVLLREGGVDRRLAVDSPLDLAFSADGGRVAAGALDGDIRVWDVVSGRLIGVLPGHSERVVAVEFLPDGDLLSASWDKTARVWSLAALERPVDVLAGEVALAWGDQAP
jgi:eukaryotic-like serine/threonine-protein kinase